MKKKTKKATEKKQDEEQGRKEKPERDLCDVYDQLIFLRDSIRAVGWGHRSLTINEAFGEGAAIILDNLAEDVAKLM